MSTAKATGFRIKLIQLHLHPQGRDSSSVLEPQGKIHLCQKQTWRSGTAGEGEAALRGRGGS